MHITGRISYRRDGAETGREWFSIARQGDDGLQIEARCEMDDDALTRQCAWRLDKDFFPTEAFVRVERHARLEGAAIWRIAGSVVEQAYFDPGAPAQTATFDLGETIRFIALHPLIGDGFAALLYDRDGPEEQPARGCVSSSHQPNGAGPQRADGYDYRMRALPRAAIEVPAGRFECDVFALSWRRGWPDAILHVIRDGPAGRLPILAKLHWDLLRADYVLTDLSAV